MEVLTVLQNINSRCVAFIRPKDTIDESIRTIESTINEPLETPEIADLFALKEIQLMSRLMYSAIDTYIKSGGKSRGSYLIIDSISGIRNYLQGAEIDTQFRDKVLNTAYMPSQQRVSSAFRPVRLIPESDTWFEQVWHEYRAQKTG